MLLIGFDVPIEQVMYLDRPLKEHTLLQVIARVNRTCGDRKKCGYVIDYYGVLDFLEQALAIFDKDELGSTMEFKDHSKDFWHRVSSIMPDYESIRQWLRENGIKLDL